MGDPHIKADLTTIDKISVFLYRGGIVLAALSMIFGAFYFYNQVYPSNTESISLFKDPIPTTIFWVFFVSVGTSIFFLHLYNAKLLKIFQSFFIISVLLFTIAFLLKESDLLPLLFEGSGYLKVIATFALGFTLATLAAIGAKEAFCFKLYEGYVFAILSALLVLIHLTELAPLAFEYWFYLVITILVAIFTFRKMVLPLHYDIGDKTKYQ